MESLETLSLDDPEDVEEVPGVGSSSPDSPSSSFFALFLRMELYNSGVQ